MSPLAARVPRQPITFMYGNLVWGPFSDEVWAVYALEMHSSEGRPRPGDDELVFGEWSGDGWDNWRERIFQPAAVAVGLPDDTIPRDLRGSFASLLIFEGLNVLEVAAQLGHKPSTCLDIYGRLFEEFDPAQRRPAVEVIREARKAVRNGTLPTGYPAERRADDRTRRATAGNGE